MAEDSNPRPCGPNRLPIGSGSLTASPSMIGTCSRNRTHVSGFGDRGSTIELYRYELADGGGVEPQTLAGPFRFRDEAAASAVHHPLILAPAVGIEPTSSGLEPDALPLDQTGINWRKAGGLEPQTPFQRSHPFSRRRRSRPALYLPYWISIRESNPLLLGCSQASYHLTHGYGGVP